MRIPRYWVKAESAGMDGKGKRVRIGAWGWSGESEAAAREMAGERAAKGLARLLGGQEARWYDYLEHPLREEIVESVREGEEEIGVITRNRYGALILNSAGVCFVDVDFPRVKAEGLVDGIGLMFSRKKKRERMQAAQEQTVGLVREWAGANPQRSFRMYRTCAGLRLLFTDGWYDPKSEEVRGLLGELKSDELYCRLTERQECFRARLTPKPWRCGCDRPPNRYPWEDEEAERKYREWLGEYEQMSQGYATCQLLETMGDGDMEQSIAAIVEVHDGYACGEGELA